MTRLRLASALLAVALLTGCATQMDRREAATSSEEKKEKTAFPTIIYRP